MRERVSVHFRVQKDIKKQFFRLVKAKGFSTCFIVETLMRAWVTGTAANENGTSGGSITINQNIEYAVKKSRRQRAGPPDNCYLNGIWTYRQPENGELLSSLGHVPECRCSVCSPCASAKARGLRAVIQRNTTEL